MPDDGTHDTTAKETAREVADSAGQVARSKPIGWAARTGLTARGLVYLLMGWLTVLLALGEPTHPDQRGVLTELVGQPLGGTLVLLLAIGFACYALWRLSEVAVGPSGEPDGLMPRARALLSAVGYLAVCATAVSVLAGSRRTQAGQQEDLAGSVMTTVAGRTLVAVIGLGFVVAGVLMVTDGLRRKFLDSFPTLVGVRRTAVVWLGRVGTVARGVVFAIVGVLTVLAAWQADPEKAGGIDAALRNLLGAPGGRALVWGLGAGLMIFGVYGLAEAAWRRVPDGALPHEDHAGSGEDSGTRTASAGARSADAT